MFLIGIFLVSILMIVQLLNLKISYDFDSYFAKNESFYQNFENYQKKFPVGQNHQVVIAIESSKTIDHSFALSASSLFNQIEQLKGIKRAFYFSKISEINPANLNGGEKVVFDLHSKASFQKSFAYFNARQEIYQGLISKDRKSFIGYFTLEKELFNDPARDTLVRAIQQLIETSKYKTHLFGIPVIRSTYSEKIWSDFLIFTVFSIALLLIVLYILFRNWLLVIIPCLTIVIGILWNFGLMGILGFSVNMISNLLVPILFVVGISDSIHLITVFYEKINHGLTKQEAILVALQEVGKATFLTALVSSVGFLSLSITSAEAIKYFGLFGFTGIIITYFLSIVIVPSLLLVLDQKKYGQGTNLVNQEVWDKLFSKLFAIAIEKRKLVIGLFSGLVLFSISLLPKIQTSLLFTNDVKPGDSIAKEFGYFERNIGYLKPFEFVLTCINSNEKINLAFLKNLEKIENELVENANFSDVHSIVFQVKYANYLLHQGNKIFFALPDTEQKLQFLLREISKRTEVPFFNLEGKKEFYFAGKIKDFGSERMEEEEIQIKNRIEKILPVNVSYTGFGHVLDQSNKSSRRDIFWGLFGDLLVVSLLMSILFKKFKFIFISLIPNIIPLIILLGIISLFEIPFSPANALILVVIFGISIDDTIHFLTHYLLIRNKDKLPIRSTLLTCGKAMLFVSFLLMAGLGVTYFSDFQAISNLGLFGMITIIFATLTEFFITPILLDQLDPQLNENRI
jgi:predicted RND superfamily exporter protein